MPHQGAPFTLTCMSVKSFGVTRVVPRGAPVPKDRMLWMDSPESYKYPCAQESRICFQKKQNERKTFQGAKNKPIIHLNVSLHSEKKIPHQPSRWLPVNGRKSRGEVNAAPFKPSEEISTCLQDIEVGKGWGGLLSFKEARTSLSLSQSLARKLSATLLYKWQIPACLLNYS